MTPNIENLQLLKNWLDSGAPHRTFDMSTFIDDYEDQTNWCGTSCCMAGYIFSLNYTIEDVEDPEFDFFNIEDYAAKTLGLSREVGHRLFFVNNSQDRMYAGPWVEISPAQASQAVQNVMTHGEPLWETVLDPSEFV